MTQKFVFLLLPYFLLTPPSFATCVIRDSMNAISVLQNDALYSTLNQMDACPESVQALKNELEKQEFYVRPAMVANRGRHNSSLGSFSFFEEVLGPSVKQGEFLFGHFTDSINGVIVLDQNPAPRKLMIEAIVWDTEKKLFNFYELIGQRKGAQWFYRGDSADALADNTYLYRDPPSGAPKFGNKMRCSACHTSGEPIMKELAFPHNDWWTKNRPLSLAPNRPSNEVADMLKKIMDAGDFSRSVIAGMHKLIQSPAFQDAKSKLSRQEQLRPLFCTTSINLESDVLSLDESSRIQIPSAIFAHPLLATRDLFISANDYQLLLEKFDMQFPEGDRRDADHAWLAPVKGYFDNLLIQMLVDQKIVSQEYVTSVLSIDAENPLFSAKRCEMLKSEPADLKRNDMNAYLKKVETELGTHAGQAKHFERLIRDRDAVLQSELSQNPRGQILEPGFRVIFPIPAP